jgi:hypothetical protein
MNVRNAAGTVFLLAQVALVVHARFVPSRWLCWAPNDYAVQYRLHVSARGRNLDPSDIQRRYHLSSQGWYENPAENIMDIVRKYEQTEGKNDIAEVQLFYRVDGGETKQWQWPEK